MTIERHPQVPPSRRRLLASAAALCAAASVGGLARAATKPRVIPVVARKFDFVPAEIRVRRGETVTLSLTAPEVPMGINIADLGVRADIIPGKPTLLTITPDKAGRFTFLCDVFCGTGHEDMSGALIVT
ncbi:cupredoxin domain-containing protein [Derxia gummosa]|uniref:Nitrous-oxide reductase n=1 Tax=Derxia gummosa DSM 723 TaxID=1121388 RepID=A0A8B6X3Q9_9BURK|nr:cupredoxin domain-containing protein [Derxia gummosa]